MVDAFDDEVIAEQDEEMVLLYYVCAIELKR